MKRTFEKAFMPPFKIDRVIDWVYDTNHNFCFQLIVDLDDEKKQQLQDILNGKTAPIINNTYKHSNGLISVNGKDFILIRGWGYLTGTGGLNLPDEEAAAIQDDLADYIIERLTTK